MRSIIPQGEHGWDGFPQILMVNVAGETLSGTESGGGKDVNPVNPDKPDKPDNHANHDNLDNFNNKGTDNR